MVDNTVEDFEDWSNKFGNKHHLTLEMNLEYNFDRFPSLALDTVFFFAGASMIELHVSDCLRK